MVFTFGLDLGQVTDPTAGVILESQGEGPARIYLLRQIIEFPLGTSYPRIIDEVRTLVARPPLRDQCNLVIDQTGVGRAVFDMFVEAGLQPFGITITPGKSWHQEDFRQYHVAKELLVGTVQKFIQTERIRSSWRVKHSRLLKKELQAFRVKITKSAHETYGADVRESQHDDKVLATSVALWFAEHHVAAVSLSGYETERILAMNGSYESQFQRIWSGNSRQRWMEFVRSEAQKGLRQGYWGTRDV